MQTSEEVFDSHEIRNVTPAPTVPTFIAAPEPAIEESQPEDQAQ
jgi:hypothetical protein